MGKDYYKILGIDKSASVEEIKKAFRQKAHQYHPDKTGGDEAKFKEVNEAYQVLGDPNRRAQYDRFGSAFEHAQATGGFSGFEGFRDFSGFANGFSRGQSGNWEFDLNDLGDIFGGFGDIFGFSSAGAKARSKRGRDIEASLDITFNEAVFGAEKEINLNKAVVCDKCSGGGAEPGAKVEACATCKGSGRVSRVQRTILGNIQTQTTCSTCGGEGKTSSLKCSKCSGAGVVRETVNLKIKIPAGIDDGQAIRLSGQGEAGQKRGQPGDLYIRVRVLADKKFNRDGDNILSEVEINFSQAVLGGKLEVETVDGPVKLKINEGTPSGKVYILRGKGVPHLHGRRRGDHLVKVKIKVPASLNRKQKKLLEELGL